MISRFLSGCGLATAMMLCAHPAAAQEKSFDIPAQSIVSAVTLFGQQSGLLVVAPVDGLGAVRSRPVKGRMNARAALRQLIGGTGLEVVSDSGNQIILRRSSSGQRQSDAGSALSDASESIIVTGTRDRNRTKFTSLTPVDVVQGNEIQSSVSSQLSDGLAMIVPSIQVQKLALSDGLQFIQPVRIRGLSPDQTLVLVNGKRFHRTAFLGENGAQGPDMGQIPNFAIGSVEVLRDGSSAQYGSDAIAGVISVTLDNKPGVHAYAKASQYYNGEGTGYQLGLRAGAAIGDGGYIVGTIEWSQADPTVNANQRVDAAAFQAAHPDLTVPNPVQRWGRADMTSRHYALNAAMPVSDSAELYAFATASDGDGVSDVNWRNPDTTGSVFNPSPIFPGWDVRSVYPTGFTPRQGIEYRDYQASAGVRGQIGEKLDWDFSLSHGQNRTRLYLYNSINASLGPNSPFDFYIGTQQQTDFNINADAVYRLDVPGLHAPVNIAFGAERRVETYTVKAGETASWEMGPGAADGLAAGSSGYSGISPDQAGEWDEESYAAYVDIEIPVSSKLTLGGALRYEDYSSFGGTTNGKLAARYAISPNVALRASYLTGFRVPTSGQLNSLATSQWLQTVGSTLVPRTTGRLSPLNPVAAALGARALEPETSKTISGGLVWRTGFGLSGSLDAYQVRVDKRLSLSPNIDITPEQIADLLAQGVPGADSYTTINWFTNDYDTRTRGMDFVLAYTSSLGAGRLDLKLAYNHNKTKVLSGSIAASATQKRLFEEGLPQDNATLMASFTQGRFGFQAKGRYYGSWTDVSNNDETFQRFGGIAFFDASLSYDVTKNISVRIGAENLFDTYPDRAENGANRGVIYSRNAPHDTYGGQYYIRLDLHL